MSALNISKLPSGNPIDALAALFSGDTRVAMEILGVDSKDLEENIQENTCRAFAPAVPVKASPKLRLVK